jgi:hypothetical protein
LRSPLSFRFTRNIYTFESVAEEVRSQAGSLSLASSHTPKSEKQPLEFENKPWWENIPPVSAPPSPTLSVHSFSRFSDAFPSPTTSEFSFCPSPLHSPSPFLNSRDTRNIYWTSINPQTAAEYLSIFGTSVFEDPFAWIRYPIPGPHDLGYFSEDDDDDDDEFAGYDWDAHNPTAADFFDPFSEVDDVLALYCDSSDEADNDYSDETSYLSFDADEYSGITENAGIADTAEMLRARFVESFAVGPVVGDFKEVCVEDVRVVSIDLVLSSIF